MNKADQKRLLREMIFYRRFEERCFEAYMEHKIGGFLHLYAGQEAVATGVLEMARPGHDYVITGYRDHIHAIKAGAPARGERERTPEHPPQLQLLRLLSL